MALAACYQPEPARGLPCSSELQCPDGQQCMTRGNDPPTCQDRGGRDDDDDDDDDGGRPRPRHDVAGDALDISTGGDFAFELADARDDAASSCATGRPELFFSLTLATAQIIYLDTFGASTATAIDTAIAVRSGSCAAVAGGAEQACVDDSCGGAQSQGAWRLSAGDHCIIVEGPAASAVSSQGTLRVVRGKYLGDPLPAQPSGMVQGDTCKDDNSNDSDSCGCEPGEDHHYFFTVCPRDEVMARFETCGGDDWDSVLQLRGNGGDELACNDDSCDQLSSSISRRLQDPGLYWAIVDGCTDCGVYTLKYDLAATRR